MTSTYLRSIKRAITGSADTPLVFVCNFEAENYWARGHVGLPAPAPAGISPVVQRMEELGVLLAGPDDHLVLSRPLDPGYRAYLERLGFELPAVIVPDRPPAPAPPPTPSCDSPDCLRRLAELGSAGALLAPMGTTDAEQKLADVRRPAARRPGRGHLRAGQQQDLSVAGGRAAGLRPVPGHCCETVAEFGVRTRRRADLPIVVKDAYGVSGKGLVVLDSPAKADRLLAMVERRARRTGDARLSVVVEAWLPKQHDLNYQVTIALDGAVTAGLRQAGNHRERRAPGPRRSRGPDAGPAGRDRGRGAGHRPLPARRRLHRSRRRRRDHRRGRHRLPGTGDQCPVQHVDLPGQLSVKGSIIAGEIAIARHYPLNLTEPVSFAEVAARR